MTVNMYFYFNRFNPVGILYLFFLVNMAVNFFPVFIMATFDKAGPFLSSVLTKVAVEFNQTSLSNHTEVNVAVFLLGSLRSLGVLGEKATTDEKVW